MDATLQDPVCGMQVDPAKSRHLDDIISGGLESRLRHCARRRLREHGTTSPTSVKTWRINSISKQFLVEHQLEYY